jgi:type VI secretion system secreted protein Hcp
MHDFGFTIYTMKGSPKLAEKCATGEHIASAVLTCRKAGGTPTDFLVYTFTDLLISTYSLSGSSGLPTENITFNFAKVEGDYGVQDTATGQITDHVKWGYDLKTNTKV